MALFSWWSLWVGIWETVLFLFIADISFWFIEKAIAFIQLRKVPHRKSNLFFGDATAMKNMPGDSARERRMRIVHEFYQEFHHKKIGIFWNFWRPFVLVYNWEGIREVLAKRDLLLKDYHYLKPWIGEGLITSESKKWYTRRKFLTPLFHFTTLDDFAPTIFRLTKEHLNQWAVDSPQVVEMNTNMPRFTLDVLLETLMGLPSDTLLDSREQFLKDVKKICELLPIRDSKLLYQFDFTYKYTQEGKKYYSTIKTLHEFTYKAIKIRMEKLRQLNTDETQDMNESLDENIYNNSKREKKSFMDTLICAYLNENNPTVSCLKDVQEEVDTFMFGGHDTTATSIMWTVFVLGCNVDIQEKLYEELVASFGENPQELTPATLSSQKYLDACIKESMRLIPPVPAIARKLTDDMNICGYKIPRGSQVYLELFFMHRDPDLYPEPLKFDPNRFLDANLERRSPFSFVPFSGGPRNCIGQKFALLEIKIFITLLVIKFKFRSLAKFEDIGYYFETVTRPKQPIDIEFTRRD